MTHRGLGTRGSQLTAYPITHNSDIPRVCSQGEGQTEDMNYSMFAEFLNLFKSGSLNT